jgi:GNAT superfamily N-acetyltransferase
MCATAHSDRELLHESILQANELADAGVLVREAGWNQILADWRIFLEFGTIYAVRNSAHRLVATAATLPYGDQFAWISMVLVASDYRRRGLATRLLRGCVDDLIGRQLVPIVDATPAGRTVYIGLGFRDSWGFQRYSTPDLPRDRIASLVLDGLVVRSITDEDWPRVCRYDAEVFGSDRGTLLTHLRGRAPGAELAAWRGDHIVGFVLARDGRSATQFGPLAAEDEATARALLEAALNGTSGRIYIDLADSKAALRQWMESHQFTPQRPFTRMVYGRAERFDDVARTMAVAGPELG